MWCKCEPQHFSWCKLWVSLAVITQMWVSLTHNVNLSEHHSMVITQRWVSLILVNVSEPHREDKVALPRESHHNTGPNFHKKVFETGLPTAASQMPHWGERQWESVVSQARPLQPNLVMFRHSSWEKDYGFTPNLHFNPVFAKFNSTEFLQTNLHQRVCSTSRKKGTSKHGISMIISSQWWRRDVFLAALRGGTEN